MRPQCAISAATPPTPSALRPRFRRSTRRRTELAGIVAERRKAFDEWAKANPDKAVELKGYLDGVLPQIDYTAIVHKANISTRQASADVLGVLAEKMGNMIVSSADLANSDKTDGFLKKTHAFTTGDFTGAFLQAGVSELTMAAIMNGIALHGGLRGACGTFFVFSDYMKPAVRMACLMELPVLYVWTHDAFRVGEDGPTHEPIEQEAQIRLMEMIANFSGKASMLVLRPADSAETSVAYKMAMENTDTPTALILSRQDIEDLPRARRREPRAGDPGYTSRRIYRDVCRRDSRRGSCGRRVGSVAVVQCCRSA